MTQPTNKIRHRACGQVTRLVYPIAEKWASDPTACVETFCVHCKERFAAAEFEWIGGDGEVLGELGQPLPASA